MRVLALFCGAFSAGIFAAQYLAPQNFLLPLSAAAFLTACLRFALPGKAGKRVLLIAAGLSLAFGYNWLYARQTVDSLSALYGTEQDAVMTLCGYADETAWGARVFAEIDGLPGQVAYYGKRNLLELSPGDAVRDIVRLEDARRIRDSDITTFTSRGVFTLAYGRGVPVTERGEGSVRWLPTRMGEALRQRLRELFPADVAPFLSALLTGDRTGLSVAADADMEEAGLSHVLAVSGMHCGFLIALIAFLLRRRPRSLTAAVGIASLVFYALMTGAKPSVVRACVMLSLLLLAPLARREHDAPTALSVALFLILLQNPYAAASVSLQLSFASVTGLLWLTPKLYAALTAQKTPYKLLSLIRNAIAATLSASVGAIAFTAPLYAVYFGVLSLIAPLSNLLCLWAVGAAFASGLLVSALSFVSTPVAALLTRAPALLARYVLFCAHALSKIPLHAVYFANPLLKYWLAYAYLTFALARICKRRGARLYVLAAALSCAALLATLQAGRAAYRNALDALALDVGQGQSVILASQGRFTMVDCGSANSWKDAGRIAAQNLRNMGCRRLDALILTHYDSDHVNGLEALLARLDVKALYVPEASGDGADAVLTLAARYGVPVRVVRERVAAEFGAGRLTLFPPVGNVGGNDRGLSALASVGDTDFLITGDMGADAERALLKRYALPDLEAFVVGHHGSKYSTSEDLLTALTPEIACISVGSNSYGHPTPETLQRLAEHGCAVYRTDRNGSIHLCINPELST